MSFVIFQIYTDREGEKETAVAVCVCVYIYINLNVFLERRGRQRYSEETEQGTSFPTH